MDEDQENPIAAAMKTLSDAMQSDPDYYHGWHANLSMMMQDEGIGRDAANDRARDFLKTAFQA